MKMNSGLLDCGCNLGLKDSAGVEMQKALNERQGVGGLTTFEKIIHNKVPLFVGVGVGFGASFLVSKLVNK